MLIKGSAIKYFMFALLTMTVVASFTLKAAVKEQQKEPNIIDIWTKAQVDIMKKYKFKEKAEEIVAYMMEKRTELFKKYAEYGGTYLVHHCHNEAGFVKVGYPLGKAFWVANAEKFRNLLVNSNGQRCEPIWFLMYGYVLAHKNELETALSYMNKSLTLTDKACIDNTPTPFGPAKYPESIVYPYKEPIDAVVIELIFYMMVLTNEKISESRLDVYAKKLSHCFAKGQLMKAYDDSKEELTMYKNQYVKD